MAPTLPFRMIQNFTLDELECFGLFPAHGVLSVTFWICYVFYSKHSEAVDTVIYLLLSLMSSVIHPMIYKFCIFFILEKHGPLTFSIPDIRRRSIHDIFSAIFLFICQVDTGKKYSGRFEIVLDLLCGC